MRVMLVLAAIGAVLAAAILVLEPLLGEPARGRAQKAVEAPDVGPFAFAGRQPAADSGRAGATTELARRLQVDAVLPGRARGRATVDGPAVARRMLRETCRGSNRLDECHQAVSSAVIRRVWASLSRTDDPAGKAERLLALGDRLALTALQVTNSIRAELDEELTRAVSRGAMGWRRRDAAITCFDAPERCALR